MMKTKQMWAILVFVLVLFTFIESSSVKLAPWPAEYEQLNNNLQQQQQQQQIDNSECDDDIKIISRREWGGRHPKHDSTHLVMPVKKIIIQSTYTNNCTTQENCANIVRSIQTNHMNVRKWNDIGYNFLVGGDGGVYVGRGWNIEGAHTRGHNKRSVCIAFIGNFDLFEPPMRQLCAAQKLIQEGIRLEHLSNSYNLFGHRQLTRTESPGAALYQIIKTWDHWTDQVV